MRITRADQIQVLICSANLGNACPDQVSWNLWVPEDGACDDVVSDSPKYPVSVPPDPNDHSTEENNNDGHNDTEATQHKQFALVVFGLQESTFETEESLSSSKRNSQDSFSVIGETSDHLSNRKTGKLKKMKHKTKKTIESLTASRDHTLKSGSASSSKVLHTMIAQRLPSYDKVVSFQRGEMRLEILANSAIASIEVLHVAAQNTGRHGLANKGGIVAELLVNGNTRLAFVTTHLEAHEGRYATRVATMNEIFSGTKEKHHDCSLAAHHSFVMGDLNFRSEHPDRETMGEEKHKELVWGLVEQKDWKALYELDELSHALQRKDCLVGYRTPHCFFPPTFKVERETGFKHLDQRLPSYTDRVLWKSNHLLDKKIQPLVYEPVGDFSSSDHKPIRAAFSIELNNTFKLPARLPRTRSLLNLNINKSDDNWSSANDRCQLFVNNIEFKIFHREDKKSNWMLPSPYLCLITDPPDCLQNASKTAVRMFLSKMAKATFWSRTKSTHTNHLGFPRSSIQHQTLESACGDEEVSVHVTTHNPDGTAMDLSGAMLFLTVMDHKPPEGTIIGTVALNLAAMMQSCRPCGERSGQQQRRFRGLLGRLRTQSAAIFRSASLGAGQDDSSDFIPIESYFVDQPLMKNGIERGTLRCTVEVWWIDSALGSSVLLSATREARA